ncbi:MAG: PadR family transcriptional regulator [Gemmatimonadetes bacterium]|nr:PadR family transcriptional regulator [Gemmatimonadota bacterium]
MSRDVLGELEHQVLLALLRCGADAYTAPLVLELEARTGRSVSTAAVYVSLRRLEDKGLVTSELRSPGAEGGRDRRHFVLTDEGEVRLREARTTLLRLWDGVEPRLDEAP